MKIAITSDVIYPFTTGGSEIRNNEILKRLAKKGHEVHIYGAKLWKGKDTINLDGITIHGVSRYNGLSGTNGRRSVFDPVFLAINLFFLLLKERFDIIDNLHFVFLNCYSTKMISVIKRTPLVFTWQQHFGRNYLIGFLGKVYGNIANILEKQTIYFSRFNVASSEIVKRDLIKEKMNEKRIEVIHNGVDIEMVNSSKSLKKRYDLIFVGRFSYQKHLELLIHSVKFLINDFPNIKVCLIGDGDKKGEIMKLVSELNVRENIEFVGEIKDKKKVFQYLKSSKIFVLPSLFEGFPLVTVEANACGLPFVTPDFKQNRTKEFVDGNGLVAKPTPEGMAKEISYLLNNEKERKKMGEKGKEMAKEFDWDKIADETEEYYKKIIKQHKQSK